MGTTTLGQNHIWRIARVAYLCKKIYMSFSYEAQPDPQLCGLKDAFLENVACSADNLASMQHPADEEIDGTFKVHCALLLMLLLMLMRK